MSKNLEDDQYNAEAYLQRARDRKAAEEEAISSKATSRKLLSARTEHVDVNKNVGKRTYVTIEMDGDREIKRGAGFFCEVCKHTSMDSQSHYAHLSSRYHLTNAGFDMRVAKGTVDQVKDRFRKHSKKRPSLAEALARKLKKNQGSGSGSSGGSGGSGGSGSSGSSGGSGGSTSNKNPDNQEPSAKRRKTSFEGTKTVLPSVEVEEPSEATQETPVEDAEAETDEQKMARLMGFSGFT